MGASLADAYALTAQPALDEGPDARGLYDARMSSPPVDAWWKRVGPWVGIGTSPAAVMTGGGLASGMDGTRLILAIGLGVAALCALATVQGIAGQRQGRRLVDMLVPCLGTHGARFAAGTAMALMMLGWFGVNVDAAGTAAARLADVPRPIGVVVFALLALVVTVRGVGHLSAAALVAGLATTVMVGWSLVLLGGQDRAAPVPPTHSIGVWHGVALVVGYGAAFALRTPDFTRDLARPRQVVACAVVGLGAPLVAFAATGAAVYAATGEWIVADMWHALGAERLGYGIIAVGFFGSVMTNLFSGALAVGSAAGLRPGLAMGAVFGIGLALALAGLASQMLSYLALMAVTAPGLVVVCVAFSGGGTRKWNVSGMVAWAASSTAGIAAMWWAPGAALAASLAVALIAVVLLNRRNMLE